jgi:hypothetical protein
LTRTSCKHKNLKRSGLQRKTSFVADANSSKAQNRKFLIHRNIQFALFLIQPDTKWVRRRSSEWKEHKLLSAARLLRRACKQTLSLEAAKNGTRKTSLEARKCSCKSVTIAAYVEQNRSAFLLIGFKTLQSYENCVQRCKNVSQQDTRRSRQNTKDCKKLLPIGHKIKS